MKTLKNGTVWKDTDNNPIHAHGGHILYDNGWYYWYGEDRRENYYINCYRSKDLMNWEFRGHVLTTKSEIKPINNEYDLTLVREQNKDYGIRHELCLEQEDRFSKVNIERPKVLYNSKTKKYVMWAHFENGLNYDYARAAVATCDTPDGDFVYHGSFNPLGYMSRDCTLFQDDNGKAYFISSSNNNEDTHIYSLSEDYLSAEKLINRLFIGELREAPVLFKKDGRYFILGSYCSGWDPNQCKYSSSDSIDGEWEPLKECADDTTYHSQPAFAINLKTENKDLYLYMGDRWSGGEYFSSSYVMLPIEFKGTNELDFSYHDKFYIDVNNASFISNDNNE